MTTINENDVVQGQDNTLGPGYFSARRFAVSFVSGMKEEQFKPIIEKITKDIHTELWNKIADSMIYDIENSVQFHIWQTVDDIVKYLLGGTKWAMDKYALGERYDCDKVREAIAKHIPRELQEARIVDLEEENKKLKDELEWARKYR